MDTSFWKKLKPTVEINDTNKIFYRKYLFKAEIHCNYVYAARHFTSQSVIPVTWREQRRYLGNQIVSEITLKKNERSQLEYYSSLIQTKNEHLLFRVSGFKIIIFSDNEEVLYNAIKDAPNIKQGLKSIHRPKNQSDIELLTSGNILVVNKPSYKYKITLREKFINPRVKQQLLNYFENLGDEVNVIPSCRKSLRSNFEWFSSGYIYANDEDIQVFIELICPGLVSGIFKLAKIDR